MAPSARAPRKRAALAPFCPGKVIGFPVSSPCSLAKAMNEPENVTPPISVPRRIVTPVVPAPTAGAVTNSATATSADAPPPKPLKMPTSCGIWVISTLRAAKPPITPPIAMPIRIPVHERISASTTVAMIAMSIARAASALPPRAVAGDWSRLRPTTKRIAESR